MKLVSIFNARVVDRDLVLDTLIGTTSSEPVEVRIPFQEVIELQEALTVWIGALMSESKK